METVRTIAYDDKTVGRKVLVFPPDLPFADHLTEILRLLPTGEEKDNLLKIAVVDSVFKQASLLGEYLATSGAPHTELMRIAALAASGESAGLKLLQAALLTVPPAEELVMELVDFRNVTRVMAHIAAKEKAGKTLRESEDWFRKKALLLSTSHPLPEGGSAASGDPWLGWGERVRRAIADPDHQWDQAILEHAKTEIEALDLRIRLRLATIDFVSKERTTVFLIARGDEARWRIETLEGAYQRFGEPTIVVAHKLGGRWAETMAALRSTAAGNALADLFDTQLRKVHSHPQIRLGTALMRALLMHPLLLRAQRKPDYLSCLALYADAAAGGSLEILLHKPAAVNVLKTLLDLPGFDLQQRTLAIDLRKVPSACFIDLDGMPREVDWTNIRADAAVSWRSLVITYMDNDNFIVELLNNPRVIAQPGIMPLIAQKSRSTRVLNILATNRALHTGFANKEVPVNLLMNPAKIPLSALRKFIHVRFMDKATLSRMAGKGSQIREEVRREVERYLGSLK